MPERALAEYEAIPRSEKEAESFQQAARRVIGPWVMHILTVVIIILIVVDVLRHPGRQPLHLCCG